MGWGLDARGALLENSLILRRGGDYRKFGRFPKSVGPLNLAGQEECVAKIKRVVGISGKMVLILPLFFWRNHDHSCVPNFGGERGSPTG